MEVILNLFLGKTKRDNTNSLMTEEKSEKSDIIETMHQVPKPEAVVEEEDQDQKAQPKLQNPSLKKLQLSNDSVIIIFIN